MFYAARTKSMCNLSLRTTKLPRQQHKFQTCKVLGYPCVNGPWAMRHCVVLSHLSEESRVIAKGPYQGQVASLAGPALWHFSSLAGQIHSVLSHAPVGCPLPTCSHPTPALSDVLGGSTGEGHNHSLMQMDLCMCFVSIRAHMTDLNNSSQMGVLAMVLDAVHRLKYTLVKRMWANKKYSSLP